MNWKNFSYLSILVEKSVPESKNADKLSWYPSTTDMIVLVLTPFKHALRNPRLNASDIFPL